LISPYHEVPNPKLFLHLLSFLLKLGALFQILQAHPLATQRESKIIYAYAKVICKTNIARSKR